MSDELKIAPEDIEVIIDWPELALGSDMTIREEIEDPRFLGKRHSLRSTYTLGCRGPLCKKGNRDDMRKYNKVRGAQFTKTSPLDKYSEILDAITVWYLAKIEQEREKEQKAS